MGLQWSLHSIQNSRWEEMESALKIPRARSLSQAESLPFENDNYSNDVSQGCGHGNKKVCLWYLFGIFKLSDLNPRLLTYEQSVW